MMKLMLAAIDYLNNSITRYGDADSINSIQWLPFIIRSRKAFANSRAEYIIPANQYSEVVFTASSLDFFVHKSMMMVMWTQRLKIVVLWPIGVKVHFYGSIAVQFMNEGRLCNVSLGGLNRSRVRGSVLIARLHVERSSKIIIGEAAARSGAIISKPVIIKRRYGNWRGCCQNLHRDLVLDLGTSEVLCPHLFEESPLFDRLRWTISSSLLPELLAGKALLQDVSRGSDSHCIRFSLWLDDGKQSLLHQIRFNL
mmetsp:Transcript_15213/g.31992  ORF Transcript_15213/g.31992 Transcript_15213/m.31992 type:complete len:254 (-) Transcript_15213:710-1471(-)